MSAGAASLRRTVRALRTLARARTADALGENVDRFLEQLDEAECSPEKLQALESSVDAWLAHSVGTVLVRVGGLLADDRADLEAVREVLRASWMLSDLAESGRAELAEIGGLMTTSLAQGDRRGARAAVGAAKAWWEKHQGLMAAGLRRSLRQDG
jgi:hypothetical protein